MNRNPTYLASGLLACSLLPAQGPDDVGPRRDYKPAPAVQAANEQAMPQTQAGNRLAAMRTPIHTAPDDLGLAYGSWAAGDSYKASFHAGMTFVPYLGAEYPTTQTWHWQTTSARLGGVELLAGQTATPAQRGSYRYEYQFGPLTEAYDVLEQGLEQTFVLSQRPAVGDLVIRGAVTSLLRSRNVGPADQALVFTDTDNHDIMVYGRAIAFDANGERVTVTTSYTDGVITLVVPGSFVERAALPLTVDPLLTRVSVATWGTATFGVVSSVDVGRDDNALTDNVMVTYARSASATDSDMWARLCDDDFSGTSIVYTDITTSWSTDQASCAFVGGSDRWALVMRRLFPTLTPIVSQIRCHVHASGDVTLLTNWGFLNPPTDHNDWRADVGGVEAFATGNNALVVFQREDNTPGGGAFSNVALSEIHASLLDTTTANGTFGTTFQIKPSATHDNERASVNQVAEGGASFSWICVYQRFIDGATDEDWDLNGARINQAGTVATGTWISDLATVSPAQHQLGAVVEGQSGRYAVVFTTVDVPSVNFKTGLIAGKQVQLERFDWLNTAASPSADQAPVEIRNNADRRWEATGLGYDTNDDSHWACGFRAVTPGTPAVYYTRVGFNGGITEGPGTLLYFVAGDTPIDGSCVYDNDNDTFLFAYGINDGGPGHPVYGHVLTYDATPAPLVSGVSCSAASISWSGNRQIGAEFNQLNLFGAPASAIHLMLLATATVDVLVPISAVFPGCRLLVAASGPDYLGIFPVQFGANVSWQLPLPPAVDPQTIYMQDWYLDATNLLYSTQRIAVQLVK